MESWILYSKFVVYVDFTYSDFVATREELVKEAIEQGTKLVQAVADALFNKPSTEELDGPIVKLPAPTTKLPREKPVWFSFSLIFRIAKRNQKWKKNKWKNRAKDFFTSFGNMHCVPFFTFGFGEY